VAEALARAIGDVVAAAARPSYARSDDEVIADLAAAHDLVSRAIGLVASLVHEAHSRDLPRQHDSTSAVAWLRDLLRVSAGEARQLVTLGNVLSARPMLAHAVASGLAKPTQLAVIGRVIDNLIDTDSAIIDPVIIDKVEASLVDHAARFEPAILHRLGERILAHVDPDLADRRLREQLERDAKRAQWRRGFSLCSDGLGGVRLTGSLDIEGAAIVSAALEPLAKPVRGDNGPDPRTASARRADALVDVCRIALAAGGLPENGGSSPQLNVTVNLDALRRDMAIGELDTGALLSPTTIRRMACQATILPAVLDGVGVPIDVGRSRRLFSGAARQAVLLRDRGCAFPGCDRPPRWCDIHHVVSWLDGGSTDRDNGVALCSFHHRLIHRGDWTVRLGVDKRPEFIPPVHIDPCQRPRRNPYHPRR